MKVAEHRLQGTSAALGLNLQPVHQASNPAGQPTTHCFRADRRKAHLRKKWPEAKSRTMFKQVFPLPDGGEKEGQSDQTCCRFQVACRK